MTAPTTASFDQDAYDDLDDFESEDLEAVEDADDDYLTGMWGGRSFRLSGDRLADTLVAHGMVQSFVNAFARDGHYAVSFDESVSTAGTDMNAKRVVITPAPIADPNLSAEQAGKILTGLAVHEISHPRYGRQTSQAVSKVFPGNAVADRLSNLLDDIRIEQRFIADYPGYAGVFDPTLEYVGQASVKRNGGNLLRQKVTGQVNIAIAATRYPTFTDWTPDVIADRDWWINWAAKWSREDSPKRHVDAIREALAHVAAAKAAKPAPAPKPQPAPQAPAAPQAPQAQGGSDDESDESTSTPSDESGEGEAQDAPESTETGGSSTGVASDDDLEAESQSGSGGEAGEDAGEDEADASSPMSDDELNDATRTDPDELYGDQAASCSGSESVEQSARDAGVSGRDINDLRTEADNAIEAARNIEGDGHGGTVDVAKSLRGLTHGGTKLGPSSLASRYIRNAILRSRTGNTDVSTHMKRGRLDGHGLARVGYGDTRIFEKRTAPSPGKYLVWVLVDASSSMDYELPYAAQVAHAMATATHGTPTVRMAVFAWSNPFRGSSYADAGVAKVWENGRPVEDIFRMAGLRTGGTPDSTIMGWAARAIKRDAKPDEQPVIIIASDGAGYGEMNARVEEARKMGVAVYSVSFGRSFTEAEQLARFGKGNYVTFAGSIVATAKPLANLFAKIVGATR